jgi:hypothetical protein
VFVSDVDGEVVRIAANGSRRVREPASRALARVIDVAATPDDGVAMLMRDGDRLSIVRVAPDGSRSTPVTSDSEACPVPAPPSQSLATETRQCSAR